MIVREVNHVTPIQHADEVIRSYLSGEKTSIQELYARRRDLEEFVEYLNVFVKNHPIEDYDIMMK